MSKEKETDSNSAFQLRISFDGNQHMHKSSWILDTGETSHICFNRRYYYYLQNVQGSMITLADERKLKAQKSVK